MPNAEYVDPRVTRCLHLSRFARRLVESDPGLRAELVRAIEVPFGAVEMRAALESATQDSEAQMHARLRRLRNRVMLRLIARDLAGLADLSEVVDTTTRIAEIAFERALDCLNRSLCARYGEPTGAESRQRQELLVVAMGKFGGEELNVSSDVDVVFVYPEEGQTDGKRSVSNFEYFTLLAKKLIAALANRTPEGFVFRVDTRLRPYGDSGPLVGSFSMLENYFITQGREWERYAWIKARAVCGAREPELLAIVTPFVYRRHLDFSAFASLREIHAQIRREAMRRDAMQNIKTGAGGIREIEFIAQVFQLIRGGRSPELRQRPTLAVLDKLAQWGALPREAVAELKRAYCFLRNLEHRLQYLDDQQTQSLPKGHEDQALIAEGMNFPSYEAFCSELSSVRERVIHHFEDVFAAASDRLEQHPLSSLWDGSLADVEAQTTLAQLGYVDPKAAWERLSSVRGRRYSQMSSGGRSRLDLLIPRAIEEAAKLANPDAALERLLQLFEAVSRRESYLALLLEYPEVMSALARLLGASHWVSQYLVTHPILLDEFIDPRLLYHPPDWRELAGRLSMDLDQTSGDVERQMDMLRHFKHSRVFRLLAQDLAGLLPLPTLSDHLSALADVVLEETLKRCWANLKDRHRERPRFAIIGYGKLGGKELGYASDLDLVFIYDDDAPEAPELYSRLALRLITWLTSFTPAGVLYETDLRLRPSGESGLLVSPIVAFEQYQRERAWVWEHQALTRARFCAGDESVGRDMEAIRVEVLRAPRELSALKREIVAMRKKMHDAHPNRSGLFDVKHDAGGIIDVEFVVQYLVLGYAQRYPELTGNIGNLALLKLAVSLGLLPAELAEAAREAYREFRQQQHALRLQGSPYARVEASTLAPHAQAVVRLWQEVFGAS
jgi:[glutamine synthetase] adenylyltransferase / [glutamine synthetase]-adenylyl-L-tyrosine phosphorylase